jgi:hypothetical protein
MAHLNHKGPDESGSKTGRKLGTCNKDESEQKEKNELGIGQGLRRKSGGGTGKKRRLKYNEDV